MCMYLGCNLCALFDKVVETLFTPGFLFIIFVYPIHLEYLLSDESDESDKLEYDELVSKYGSAGTFGTGLGGLLRGVGLSLGVTLSAGESCDSDRGSLVP